MYTPTNQKINKRNMKFHIYRFVWNGKEGWMTGHAAFFASMPPNIQKLWETQSYPYERDSTYIDMNIKKRKVEGGHKPDFRKRSQGVCVYPAMNGKVKKRKAIKYWPAGMPVAIFRRKEDDRAIISADDRYVAHAIREFPDCRFYLFEWNQIWGATTHTNRVIVAYLKKEIVAIISGLFIGK